MANSKWSQEQQKIADLDAIWGEAATKALAAGAMEHDFKTVTDIYSKEGSVVWQGFEPGHGAAEIEAHWKQANAKKDFQNSALKFDPVRIEIVGILAMDFGQVVFTSKATDGQQSVDIAKYFVVWRYEGGAWKVLYDCWNENK